MEQRHYSFDYLVFDSPSTLPESDRELFLLAEKAAKNSYAPYSRYHVGAAVKLRSGRFFLGSNQENLSFPAALCAERVALFAAMATHPDDPPETIAITAFSEEFEVTEPVPPCGICRQVIIEYEMKFKQPICLILGGKSGSILKINSISNLLPLAFIEKGLVK